MAIKFGFSDECGNYQPKRTERYNQINPHYARSLFLINGTDYKELSNNFKQLKLKKYKLPDNEIKWSYIWSLKKHQMYNKKPKKTVHYYFLKDYNYNHLISFLKDSLNLLKHLDTIKTIFTYTINNSNVNCSEIDLYKMHIRTILQRVQYESQENKADLSVLFFDSIGDNKNKVLRETYHKIYSTGDFIKNYTHIKDSLNIEYSHHSTGIQLSDFLAGCFTGFLKEHEESIEIFNQCILTTLRLHKGSPHGAGICEIPSNNSVRNNMIKLMEKYKP